MDRKVNISEAEWEVMRALWRDHPRTGNELAEELAEVRHWHPKTVKTLLNRLVAKGAVGFTKQGRQYAYFPKVKQRACVRQAARQFVRSVFGGAVKPMLAALLEDHDLSDEEIRELKAILDDKSRR